MYSIKLRLQHKESQHAEVKIQNEKFLYLKYS